jgi:hypothetical protein
LKQWKKPWEICPDLLSLLGAKVVIEGHSSGRPSGFLYEGLTENGRLNHGKINGNRETSCQQKHTNKKHTEIETFKEN